MSSRSDKVRRFARWAGGIIVTSVVLALAFYLVLVGLDKADKVASVLALFVGLAGLGAAVYGLFGAERRRDAAHPPKPARPPVGDSPPGDVHNTISGGVVHGAVIQGRDFSGPLNIGGPSSSSEEDPDPQQ